MSAMFTYTQRSETKIGEVNIHEVCVTQLKDFLETNVFTSIQNIGNWFLITQFYPFEDIWNLSLLAFDQFKLL